MNILFYIKINVVLISGLLISYGSAQETSKHNTIQNKEGINYMSDQADSLPFNLSKDDIASVDIFYAYYSAKTGAGKQEIIITGTGYVKLFFSKSMYDNAPQTREGNLSQENIIHLLEVMEDENFLGLEDHYPPENDPHARRMIRLTLPHETKTVILDASCVPEFERIAGAIKFAVGIALPEIFQHRFFPNL